MDQAARAGRAVQAAADAGGGGGGWKENSKRGPPSPQPSQYYPRSLLGPLPPPWRSHPTWCRRDTPSTCSQCY